MKFQKTSFNDKFNKSALERIYDGPNSWGKTYGEHKEYLEFSKDQFLELQEFALNNEIIFSSSAMDMVSKFNAFANCLVYLLVLEKYPFSTYF